MWEKKEKREAEEQLEKQPAAPSFAPERAPEEMAEELETYLAEDHGGKGKKKKGGKRERGEKKFLLKRLPMARWSRKKRLLAAAALLLAAFLLSRAACAGKGETAQAVGTTPLSRGTVTSVLSLSGPVSGTDSADVVSNLHAEVLQITVKEGDRVEKGQTLAVLDDSDVQEAVDIAQNAYDLAVSEYEENKRDTQNRYEKAVQDYQTAKLDYDRNSVLYNAGDISSAQMEAVSNALRDAEREKSAFRVEGGRALPDKSYELKVQSAQFELEQKKDELEDVEVKSPIAGTVTRVNSKVGQFADKPEDEKPMFVVENLDSLEMEIAVSEYSIGQVQVGQKAEITADILGGGKAEGEVISISPTGEEKGGGSTERVVPTTIRVENGSATGLMAGITAKASIITGKAEDTFFVLQTALEEAEDGSIRIASVDSTTGSVHFIPVILGVESDLTAEILPEEEGSLTEGMLIADSPVGLTEGMTVAVP